MLFYRIYYISPLHLVCLCLLNNPGYLTLDHKPKASSRLFWKTLENTRTNWLGCVSKDFSAILSNVTLSLNWEANRPRYNLLLREACKLQNSVETYDGSYTFFCVCVRVSVISLSNATAEKWTCTQDTPRGTYCACPSWVGGVSSVWCRWSTSWAAAPSRKRTRTTSRCLRSSAR